MKKLLAFALATMMTQQALAVNWVQVSESTNGNKFYIDLDSIQADYLTNGTPVVTAWIQTEYKQAQDAGDGKKYWSDTAFFYFNCRARKTDIEFGIAYDKQGREVAREINSSFSRYSSTNWDRAVPGSVSETLLDTVCAYTN